MKRSEIALSVEATYKGASVCYCAHLGVSEYGEGFKVKGEWHAMWGEEAFIATGGKQLLDPVFETRVNSAMCVVNHLKLCHVKYRLDTAGEINLVNFTYKNGLEVRTQLFVEIGRGCDEASGE